MRGSVRKRGKTWSVIIDIGTDENGKRKQKWYSGFKTKKEAEAKKTELIYKLNTGEFADSKNITTEEYLKQWLRDYALQNVASQTYSNYELIIRVHLIPSLGNYKLEKLTSTIVQSYYTNLKENSELSNTSINYIHRILNHALKQAVKWQIITRNPCEATQPPRKDKYIALVLDNKEIDVLLEACKGTPIYTPVIIALTTGMRLAEIAALQWKDINFDKKNIYINNTLQNIDRELVLKPTKNASSRRTVYMMELLVEHLKLLKTSMESNLNDSKTIDVQFVCAWEDFRPKDPHYISKKFRKIKSSLNITQIRFHDLRHTHATMLLKEGIHPKIVADRLGHSQISITLDTYSHVIPNMQKSAIEELENKFTKNE